MPKECPQLCVISQLSKSETVGVWMRLIKRNLKQAGENEIMSTLMPHFKVLQITQKIFFINIFRCFDDHQMQIQNLL